MPRPGRIARTALAAAALATTVAGGLVGHAGPATARIATQVADDGLRFESHASYEVDVDAAAVRVAVDVTLTNETPPTVRDGVEEVFFFPEIGIPVLAEATNLQAVRAGGQPLTVDERSAGNGTVAQAVIDLEPDLFFGDTQSFRLSYDLPNLPPRAAGFTRVNPAFVTFAAFNAGDPGRTSVEIVVPDRFAVEHTGADVDRDRRDGAHVLSATALADPATWFVVVVGRDDDQLLTRTVTLGARTFVIRSWPDDPEWAGFVETTLQTGVPALEELIGLPWPLERDLTLIEAASPYIYGYAGWYSPADGTIEVGDRLDARVVLHELSHVWFNDALFTQRWIGEAFAEEIAARALARLGRPQPAPKPIVEGDPGRLPLATWGDPALSSESVDASEAYGYNTSFAVLREVVDEVGVDALREVIEAASDRTIAYRGDPPTERVAERVDSRRLLDLLEETAGSSRATDLFARYVFPSEELAAVAARAEARSRYAELVTAGDGRSAPLAVRRAMSAWNFETARARIDAASGILAVRDDVADAAADLGLAFPASFEDAYETSDDLDEAAAFATRLQTAATRIEEAQAAVDDDHGIWETIGLWWSDASAAVGDARDAFEQGDGPGAVQDASRAIERVEGARTAGMQRAGGAAGVIVLAGLGGWRLSARRRRVRRDAPPEDPGTSAEPPWVG